MAVPAQPKIFHITHVDNLPQILSDGALLPDAVLIARRANVAGIGMTSIKQRRLTLPVPCHPGDQVGDCVPFLLLSATDHALPRPLQESS